MLYSVSSDGFRQVFLCFLKGIVDVLVDRYCDSCKYVIRQSWRENYWSPDASLVRHAVYCTSVVAFPRINVLIYSDSDM